MGNSGNSAGARRCAANCHDKTPALSYLAVVGIQFVHAKGTTMPKVLIVHGAGMNMRGKAQIDVFGPMTLPQYDEHIRKYASELGLSLIHISEPTRLGMISYAVFCLKKKKKT